jgi:HAD superfamily hydrolase (TIGR01509 family)
MKAAEMKKTRIPNRQHPFSVLSVMFDLDGTLIDSLNVYYKVVMVAFEKLNLPPLSKDKIYAAVEDGQFIWERVLPAGKLVEKEALIQRGIMFAREAYPEIFRREVDFFEGVPELLVAIRALDIKIGIVTATPRDNMAEKERLLTENGVAKYIDTIVTNDDAPQPKPAPDTILECCRRLSVPPEHSLFVGDTHVDMRAGKAAGTMTAAVLTGFDNRETLQRTTPDVILNQVSDLSGMIVKKK